MVNANSIGLHPSGENNSKRRNNFGKFHRSPSLQRKPAVQTARLSLEFIGFHRKDANQNHQQTLQFELSRYSFKRLQLHLNMDDQITIHQFSTIAMYISN